MAMKKDQIIEEAICYIQSLYRGNSDGHGVSHTMRVYYTAMEIANSEPACDRMIVALGSLLHDADDDKLFNTENNANARAFLTSQQIDQSAADRICAVINAVSFRKNHGKPPETLEGKIVQDADRLDAIGAVGIARAFAFGGRHGRPPERTIEHFHEKLLLLKNMMNTPKAKAMAEGRHAFMEEFLREWAMETERENDQV